VGKALARRAGPRSLAAPYQVDEDAETAARRPARAHVPPGGYRAAASRASVSARGALRYRGQAGLRGLVGRASDATLEQIFGSTGAQRAVFGLMTRRFDPARAAGFEGAIVFDLSLPDGTRQPWTIEVRDGQARACPGGSASAGSGNAALTIRVALADFIRALTTGSSFHPLIAGGRMTMDGDLGVASRMAEMFGARSVY
jgi:alkyl sulfatase BDS1-like metallo-beta-lactamase superfamily hydrolase